MTKSIREILLPADEISGDPSCAPPHISVRAVSHEFLRPGQTVPVLDSISFSVRRGSFLAIVGPSGCGKSTLLDLLGGFLQPSCGKVIVEGTPEAGRRPQTVSVFQDSALFPWRTALENVVFGLELQGAGRRERTARGRELLGLVGLSGFEDCYPRQLSGGMKQRVALARALALNPQLLLMDEPFSALDALTRRRMQRELEKMRAVYQPTVVMVTHDVEEAVLLGDEVMVLTDAPASISFSATLNLARPRNRRHPEFVRLCAEIYRRLGVY